MHNLFSNYFCVANMTIITIKSTTGILFLRVYVPTCRDLIHLKHPTRIAIRQVWTKMNIKKKWFKIPYGYFFVFEILCNQCLSPVKLWVRTPFMAVYTRYNKSDKVCQWLDFLPVLWFPLFQYNWTPRYNWSIDENDVKHHTPKPKP
jgi:hypothetical protein